jgi:hypothetical protein
LPTIVEALSWRQAFENVSDPNHERIGQRMIVYRKCLTKFETVMTTSNAGFDLQGGHDIAYEKIMDECRGWRNDCKPIFVREDSEAIGSWPVLAEKVSIWTEAAPQVAVGGYSRVLENGPDVCDSESDSEHTDHGEESHVGSMYTQEMIGADGKPKNGGPPRP